MEERHIAEQEGEQTGIANRLPAVIRKCDADQKLNIEVDVTFLTPSPEFF